MILLKYFLYDICNSLGIEFYMSIALLVTRTKNQTSSADTI